MGFFPKSGEAHSDAFWPFLVHWPGVGQAPVENSRGSYKIKNVAQKKLVYNKAPSD